MMSLFSSFDLFYSGFQFLLFYIFFSFFFPSLHMSSFKMNLFMNYLEFYSKFFWSIKPNGLSKMFAYSIGSLMFCFLLLNFCSIMPFNFAWTTEVGLVFSLSLSFWSCMMMFHLFNSYKSVISHFIPEGSPIFLSFFLFLIEIVSACIRPITLTVRLCANILSGHLLMILLANLVMNYPICGSFYLGLNLVEMFVAFIQAYIFVTLIFLYFSEI